MKSDCNFKECKYCMYKEYGDDLLRCAASRLGLAWHKLFKELPIVNKFINDDKHCIWFQKEE